jgi:hypothetical protein
LRHGLATTAHTASFVHEAGALASYSASDAELIRRLAYFIDRILRGSKPADLPVEQATQFELTINLNGSGAWLDGSTGRVALSRCGDQLSQGSLRDVEAGSRKGPLLAALGRSEPLGSRCSSTRQLVVNATRRECNRHLYVAAGVAAGGLGVGEL